MKALIMDQFGEIDQLHWTELPTPQPARDEVQIKIAYTSVNPVDWKMCEGWIKKLLPHQFPLIPGWDASGVVTAVGEKVTKFNIGDEVYAFCRKPTLQWGTYAEYVCFDAENVAFKPKTLSFSQAAAIPLVGLTAWQALYEGAKFDKGQTVLIHAGAGGVGSLAIEFAKIGGAKVYTTARENNHAYVKELGADVAIDYTQEDFVKRIKEEESEGVDSVIDCVGYDTLDKSFEVVKKGGHLVSIVNMIDLEKCKQYQIHGGFVFVRPDGNQLKTIAELIDNGKVRTPHIQEMSIAEFAKGFEMSRSGRTRGKIVLKVEAS